MEFQPNYRPELSQKIIELMENEVWTTTQFGNCINENPCKYILRLRDEEIYSKTQYDSVGIQLYDRFEFEIYNMGTNITINTTFDKYDDYISFGFDQIIIKWYEHKNSTIPFLIMDKRERSLFWYF